MATEDGGGMAEGFEVSVEGRDALPESGVAVARDSLRALEGAELEIDSGLLIGPPPPAIVSEAASANEAERFEEVARIVGADVDKPYDILGVNWKMSSENIKKRLIGPEMPSREVLAAAAELTEAEGFLRGAELEIDSGLLIGPPPPAIVSEAASANEAERFEEVARIVGADVDKPYDILGVNWKMSSENIKKRYWKLSLLVHPDKCTHPQAHQAFVLLNQAFKDLQDPDKRKSLDDNIKQREEEEEMKVELRALREAAEWRKSQGISMEGDDELLAMPMTPIKQDEGEPSKRDEWMTTLPPERKPGMTMQSTSFSRTTKEGRGDASIWTNSPLDKAQKAKQNYLEAYNKAKTLGDVEGEKERQTRDADLVDKYNASKRSVSLVQKHREENSRPKKKVKRPEKEEWEGQHPWKPWDREKDLTAGRKKVNFDADNMTQGLASRFSSGSVQRNFL
ncbi:uncharacterized protein LOC141848597 [Curcuma longa]|uniref:uncharacterized protein LOC141848597 n=1 Tax=Curcuma longa TaxID=136217 RepID=UPI003D9F38E6